MLRLALLLVWLNATARPALPQAKQLPLAVGSHTLRPIQSVATARQALPCAAGHYYYRIACLAALNPGRSYGPADLCAQAISYSLWPLLYARRRHRWQLQQQAIISCIYNYTNPLQLPQAEALLTACRTLCTDSTSSETSHWYEMKVLSHQHQLRFDSALLMYCTAIAGAQHLQDSPALMHLQMLVGKLFAIPLGPNSMRLVHTALHYLKQTANYRFAAQAAHIIGFGFEAVNRLVNSFVYYEKALHYCRQVNDATPMPPTCTNMSNGTPANVPANCT